VPLSQKSRAVVHSYCHIGCAKVANATREVHLNTSTYNEFTKKKLNYPIITRGRSSKNLDSYGSISTNIIKWKSDHSVQQVFERKLITCILERLSGAPTYQEFLYTCAPLYCSGTCEKTCEKHRNTCEKLFEKICIRLRLLRKMRQPKIRLVALPPNASKRPRTRNRMQKESRRGRAGAAVSVFSA